MTSYDDKWRHLTSYDVTDIKWRHMTSFGQHEWLHCTFNFKIIFIKIKASYGTQIPAADDSYAWIEIGLDFNYFGNSYSYISIGTNGYVCLSNVFENAACGNPTRPVIPDIIVGLNYDLDSSRIGSGQIYYDNLNTESNYFKMAKQYVNLINLVYVPTYTLMITYDRVLPHLANSTLFTSFQIFLSLNSIQSYVIFSYTSCPSDLDLLAPSGLDHKVGESVYHMDSITNWCNSSNVEQPGVWVFDVSKGKQNIF